MLFMRIFYRIGHYSLILWLKDSNDIFQSFYYKYWIQDNKSFYEFLNRFWNKLENKITLSSNQNFVIIVRYTDQNIDIIIILYTESGFKIVWEIE